jgi:hypothetical protein
MIDEIRVPFAKQYKHRRWKHIDIDRVSNTATILVGDFQPMDSFISNCVSGIGRTILP